jgi:sodium-dependent phosphate cotransporter
VRTVVYLLAVFTFFLFSIDLLVTSLGHVGKETVQNVLSVTANPFISLFIGLLITAMIQSSSTTTSMIVAAVAAGSMEMQQAIPMIMGANIGTTITSNIVSLNYISDRQTFSRAFSSATLHDHFNIITTIILFPLQYKYNLLGNYSEKLSSLVSFNSMRSFNVQHAGFNLGDLMISEWLIDVVKYPYLLLLISILLLFSSIKLFTNIIYKVIIGPPNNQLQKIVFKNPYKSFAWGALITGALQSSSVTTSFIVPLVATDKIKLHQVYPFIIGANIGTTITALLAAVFKTPEAISIAMAHFMFNLVGGVILLLIPGLNKLPLLFTRLLGGLTIRHRIISLIYLIITFFLLPFAFIYLTK